MENDKLDEKYINLRKNKDCFKCMLNTKKLISDTMTPYFTFFCSKKYEYLMIINDRNINIENELIKLCDKKCNINSQDLKLFYPD